MMVSSAYCRMGKPCRSTEELEDADGHGCWLSLVKYEESQQPTQKTEVRVDLLVELLYDNEKLYQAPH